MSTITLLLIVFFTLYDSIGSKIKHPRVKQLGKWLDRKAFLFIKYFLKPNRELFPVLYKINKKLAIAFFTSAVIAFILGIPPLISGFGLIFCMLLAVALTPPKQFKEDLIKSFRFYSTRIALAIGGSFVLWLIMDEQEFKMVTSAFIDPLLLQAKELGLDLPSYLVVVITVIVAMILIFLIFWVCSRISLWLSVIPLKAYASLCFRLNKWQPLKPFYLISKSIVLIVSHFLTT